LLVHAWAFKAFTFPKEAVVFELLGPLLVPISELHGVLDYLEDEATP